MEELELREWQGFSGFAHLADCLRIRSDFLFVFFLQGFFFMATHGMSPGLATLHAKFRHPRAVLCSRGFHVVEQRLACSLAKRVSPSRQVKENVELVKELIQRREVRATQQRSGLYPERHDAS